MEVLVASGLAVFLSTMAFTLIVTTLRASVRGTSRVEMEQQALISLRRLQDDLEPCFAAGVSLGAVDPARVVLALVPLDSVDDLGRMVRSSMIVTYAWEKSSGILVRKVWKQGDNADVSIDTTSNAAPHLPQADLDRLAGDAGLPQQVLAYGVTDLSITHAGVVSPVQMVASPIKVSLRLERQAATGRTTAESFAASRSITIRN